MYTQLELCRSVGTFQTAPGFDRVPEVGTRREVRERADEGVFNDESERDEWSYSPKLAGA